MKSSDFQASEEARGLGAETEHWAGSSKESDSEAPEAWRFKAPHLERGWGTGQDCRPSVSKSQGKE